MAKLRAVADDEPPPEPTDALLGGVKRAELVALRDIVSAALRSAKTHPRDISPLTRRHQELSDEIRALDADEETDDIGEAAATPDEEFAAN